MLAYFDRPGTSNGPTEAINGRLEHLRGSALGFRSLTNYIARSLLETGGFRPPTTPSIVKSRIFEGDVAREGARLSGCRDLVRDRWLEIDGLRMATQSRLTRTVR